jgi:membrane fusion protein, copper/silver efflux system
MSYRASFFRVGTLALLVAVTVGLAACGGPPEQTVKYHCPMHPTYVSDRPGDCPICGMRLVPIEKKGNRPQGTMSGKQPSGHQAMETPQPGTQMAEPETQKYTCPMHPTFVTSDPKAKCPECGMNLVPLPSSEGASATSGATPDQAQGMDAEVPGYSPIELSAEASGLAGVQTVAAAMGHLGRRLRAVGTVVADETRVRHVHAKIGGTVEKLYVNYTGQEIKAGDKLLELYSVEAVAAQEELLRARESAIRLGGSELPEVRRGGQDLLNAARQRLQLLGLPNLAAQIERSGSTQRLVPLFSPVSGFVTTKDVVEGHQFEKGTLLFTVTDLSTVWIEADIYESDLRGVKVGTGARLTLPGDPAFRLSARVAFVNPAVTPETRTLRVRFEAPNPGTTLRPGGFVNVELEAPAPSGVIVPDSAVLDTGDRQIVFISTGNGRYEPRQVRLASRSEGNALLLAGVKPGEQVVVKGNFLLDSESRLRAALASEPMHHDHGGGK